ncbi:hypothetical protein [Lusitaniella coriacea]|uniref:hypothetical protein n=1 Tax=Lusitaniella coriacea TaxID=1983105 RepID=UPI003CEEBDFB
MQTLTDALERIMSWLYQHQPTYAETFLPGLSFDEILEFFEVMGFPPSDELIELYEWRNGTPVSPVASVFPSFTFMPLDRAANFFLEIGMDSILTELFMFNNRALFPFMEDEGSYCATFIEQHSTLTSSVVSIDADGGGEWLDYTSVTALMLTLAESYEQEAYYFNSEGDIETDALKLSRILRKYNSEILEQALSDAKILLTDFEYSFEMYTFLDRSLRTLARFRDSEGQEILHQALDRFSSKKSREDTIIYSMINDTLKKFPD